MDSVVCGRCGAYNPVCFLLNATTSPTVSSRRLPPAAPCIPREREHRQRGAPALPGRHAGPALPPEDDGGRQAHRHGDEEEGPVVLGGGQGVVDAHGDGGEGVAAGRGKRGGGQAQGREGLERAQEGVEAGGEGGEAEGGHRVP